MSHSVWSFLVILFQAFDFDGIRCRCSFEFESFVAQILEGVITSSISQILPAGHILSQAHVSATSTTCCFCPQIHIISPRVTSSPCIKKGRPQYKNLGESLSPTGVYIAKCTPPISASWLSEGCFMAGCGICSAGRQPSVKITMS